MCKASNRQARLAMIQQQQAADEARAKESARSQRLETGVNTIMKAFDANKTADGAFGGFDDNYYNKYRQAQLDYYMPELDKQFQQAQDDLTFAHARAGTLNSTMANKNVTDLLQQNDLNKANIISKADNATGQLRQSVQAQKQSLLNQLYSTENPDIAANLATNSVRTLQNATPSFDSIGDLFKNMAVGIGTGYGTYADNNMWNSVKAGLSKSSGNDVKAS